MTPERFHEITGRYAGLRIAVVGDVCLDRYLEIDPSKSEVSLETGLEVYNVMQVRAQPGAAGTILNNLVALGIGELHVVGYCGSDGEGYELRQALGLKKGVHLDHFQTAAGRHTFSYCKPLILEVGQSPRELNRLDTKNWTPTPDSLQSTLAASVSALAPRVDAVVLMDQVDEPETGVVTSLVREAAHTAQRQFPGLLVLADSRRSLREFPPVTFKMNAAEIAALAGEPPPLARDRVAACASDLARRNKQPVFITLAEQGILGVLPDGSVHSIPSFPVRGPIDIVGAGDAVTANLTAALAAKATPAEAMQLAMAAASVVVHQLGTTGEAAVANLEALIVSRGQV